MTIIGGKTMTRLRAFLYRIRGLFLKNKLERELDAEIQSHIEMQIDENKRSGMSDDEARYAALRLFGGVEQVKENYRDKRGLPLIDSIAQDVRYAIRMLIKTPVFTIVTVITLALGIGACTAVFSLINATTFKSLPVKDPHELIAFSWVGDGWTAGSFPYIYYERLRDRNRSFSSIFSSGSPQNMRMSVIDKHNNSSPEQPVNATWVSGNFFSALGINATIGRTITQKDDNESNPRAVVVISHEFWKNKFNLDPNIVGNRITLNKVQFTIIGVAQPGFSGFDMYSKTDLWWPLHMLSVIDPFKDPAMDYRKNFHRNMFLFTGRKLPNVKTEEAFSDINLLCQQMAREKAKSEGVKWTSKEGARYLSERVDFLPGHAGWPYKRHDYAKFFRSFLTFTILIVLIACISIGNLTIARSVSRKHEIVLRLSLGAGRLRIIRQLFIESIITAIIGGVLGLIAAYWGARILASYYPREWNEAIDLTPDIRILLFTIAISLLTSIIFGLLPALQAIRPKFISLNSILNRQANIRSIGIPKSIIRNILIIAHISFSLALLTNTFHLDHYLYKRLNMDLGYDRENIVMFDMDVELENDVIKTIERFENLKERIQSIPETEAVSVSPMRFPGGERGDILIEGDTAHVESVSSPVSADFFKTMGISMIAGRDFNKQELIPVKENPSPQVVVINKLMAERFFRNRNPIGKYFNQVICMGNDGKEIDKHSLKIIGIVENVPPLSPYQKMQPTYYLPYRFPLSGSLTIEMRTTADINTITPSIHKTVNDIDSGMLISNIRTIGDFINESLRSERFSAHLGRFFSMLSVFISCMGLFGVIAYTTKQRSREIGLRIALGAQRRTFIFSMLRENLIVIGMGIVIGIPASLWSMRFITFEVLNTSSSNPITTSVAAISLIIVAIFASWIPARKAATVDPMIALRCE